MVSYLTSGGGVICTKSVQSGKKRQKKNSSSDGSDDSSDDTAQPLANARSGKKQKAQHGKKSDKSKQPAKAKPCSIPFEDLTTTLGDMGEPIESNGKEILSFWQILLYGILSNIWWIR
jgi:hypothetical protein